MEKKNKILIIISIVLGVMVVGLGGYLIYDNFIKEEPVNEEGKNNDNLNEENNNTDINDNESINNTNNNEESLNNGENIGLDVNNLLNSNQPKDYDFSNTTVLDTCSGYLEKINNDIYWVLSEDSVALGYGYGGNGKLKKIKQNFDFDEDIISMRVTCESMCKELYFLTKNGNLYAVFEESLSEDESIVYTDLVATNVTSISTGNFKYKDEYEEYSLNQIIALIDGKHYELYIEFIDYKENNDLDFKSLLKEIDIDLIKSTDEFYSRNYDF